MRPSTLSACLLLGLVVLAATPAGAQVQPADVSLELSRETVRLDPNQTRDVDVTVTNPGSVDGTVELSIGIPAPWQATLSTQSFELAAGDSRTVAMTVTAPRTGPEEGIATGFTVTGTLTDGTGQFQATDQADGRAVLIVPPPPAPSSTTMPLVLSGLGIVGVIGVALWLGTGPERVRVTVVPGRVKQVYGRLVLPVFLQNHSRDGTTLLLSVDRAPDGWGLGFNLPEVFLGPGEETRVWLALRPAKPSGDEAFSLDIVVRSVDEDLEPIVRTVDVDLGDLPPPGPRAARYQVQR